jgi:hypothetical protein
MADALAAIRARRAERLRSRLTPARSCDGCDLCCTAPGIKEMDKPPGEPCKNLCGEPGRSCSIYSKRPPVCVEFHCLWRLTEAILPSWLRPADCGFMLSFNRHDQWPGVITAHVDPARPDAWRNQWAMTVFAEIAGAWNCLVAVGQSPGCVAIFCPNGTKIELGDYTPEERAVLVGADGWVGAPDYVFGPDRRPLSERIPEAEFSWGLPLPPWAGGTP